MRLDSKFGRWVFIGGAILFITETILLVNGSKSGLFSLVIGGYIFFRMFADPR